MSDMKQLKHVYYNTVLLGIILRIDDHDALSVHRLLQYTKLGLANSMPDNYGQQTTSSSSLKLCMLICYMIVGADTIV